MAPVCPVQRLSLALALSWRKAHPTVHSSCPPATPELLQCPVVGGPILLVLHLHGHDCAGEGPCLSVSGGLWGQQVWWQWGVEGVREEDKLELDL